MSEPGSETASGAGEPSVVRQQNFDADGPIEMDVVVGAGRIEIRLVDEPGVHVEVRHDPTAGGPWMQGISNLVGWFAGQFGGQLGNQFGTSLDVSPAEAVRQTRIDLKGSRLVVHSPKQPALRPIPIAVTVTAPSGSHLDARSGSGDLVVTGSAGRVAANSGSGDIAVDRADGAATVHTGSGAMRLGPMLGGLQARSGSGDIDVSSVGGSTTLVTGNGDVWLGAVQADVMARSGSGDLTVADAAAGGLELFTGSGDIRIGVRSGTAAQVDLTSGSGQARSELDIADSPPESVSSETSGTAFLRIRGKTGSGNAVVTSAVG